MIISVSARQRAEKNYKNEYWGLEHITQAMYPFSAWSSEGMTKAAILIGDPASQYIAALKPLCIW